MNCGRLQHVIFPRWQLFHRGLCAKPKEELPQELPPNPKKKLVPKPMKKRSPKFDFDLDEKVSKAIQSGIVKPRHHVGTQKIHVASLPDEVMEAALHILDDYPKKNIEADALKLAKYIWSRHPPLEEIEYAEKLKAAKLDLKRIETIDPDSLDIMEEKQKRHLDSCNTKIYWMMKSRAYNWKAIDFTEYNSLLYIVARMSPDFAALVKVLSEIKKRDAVFTPVSLTDFGSGVGTSMWAVNKVWPHSCKEFVCVDASSDMNSVADRLLRGGSLDGDQKIQPGGIFFKQFLPSSQVLKYDLVIASRSLFELPNIEMRLQTLDILWRKTLRYLVIIEAGTNAGYKLVLEARDYILQLNQKCPDDSDLQGHVFSPCPHEKFCPRYFQEKLIPCNFQVSYFPFSFSKRNDPMTDRYSYVVLKKGPISEEEEEEERYPRLVQEPLIRKGHVICEVCTKFGTISRFTGTKKKHSKECYSVLKKSRWGDLLPIILPEQKDEVLTPHIDDESNLVSGDEEFEPKS